MSQKIFNNIIKLNKENIENDYKNICNYNQFNTQEAFTQDKILLKSEFLSSSILSVIFIFFFELLFFFYQLSYQIRVLLLYHQQKYIHLNYFYIYLSLKYFLY